MPEVELKLIDGSVYGEKGRGGSFSGGIHSPTGTGRASARGGKEKPGFRPITFSAL